MARRDQLCHHGAGEIDRDGKPVAGIESGLTGDRRIDADDLAPHVDQRSSRVTGIDRGVGLNEVLNRVTAGVQPREQPSFGAHDSSRHGESKRFAERVADRQHPLADARRVGIAEVDGRKTGGGDLDDRNVRQRVGPDGTSGELPVVEQPHGHAVRALDDVVIGEDIAVLRDDEAGP